jgi:hypothetical protein
MNFDPPKSKEKLFVNICCDNRSLIGNQLLAEANDLVTRNNKIQKGGADETYKGDKKIFEATRKLYNEVAEAARDAKDYPKWHALHDSMYNDPITKQPYKNFTYSKHRYLLWEKIRQPFLEQCNGLFPEKPGRKRSPAQGRNR